MAGGHSGTPQTRATSSSGTHTEAPSRSTARCPPTSHSHVPPCVAHCDRGFRDLTPLSQCTTTRDLFPLVSPPISFSQPPTIRPPHLPATPDRRLWRMPRSVTEFLFTELCICLLIVWKIRSSFCAPGCLAESCPPRVAPAWRCETSGAAATLKFVLLLEGTLQLCAAPSKRLLLL